MRIGFIGAGRAGTSLALYLADYGFLVSGFYSKTADHAAVAAKAFGASVFSDVDSLVQKAEWIVLSVPDDAIGSVAASIKADVTGKHFLHISGAHPSAVLQNLKMRGAMIASLHPIYTFSACLQKPDSLQFVAEGDESIISVLLEKGLSVYKIAPTDKPLYHGAAVFASNYVTVLQHISATMLEKIGVPEETARILFSALSHAAIDAASEKGAEKAITGPMARGDENTIRMHLNALENMPAYREIYKILAKEIASFKDIPNIDAIKELIQ